MFSYTEENYIKAVYRLTMSKGDASTNAIAGHLQTKASSVSDMLRKLSDKQVVEYRKYKGARLTDDGKKVALDIIRKHRLWESFLVEKLNFKWDEVHDIAEQLEHIQSDELTDRLDSFLNYPSFDPHGDPIPDSNGNLPVQDSHELSNFKKGEVVIVKGVKDNSSEFLRFLEKMNITIGVELNVTDIFDFDESMQVSTEKGTEINISKRVSNNILVISKK